MFLQNSFRVVMQTAFKQNKINTFFNKKSSLNNYNPITITLCFQKSKSFHSLHNRTSIDENISLGKEVSQLTKKTYTFNKNYFINFTNILKNVPSNSLLLSHSLINTEAKKEKKDKWYSGKNAWKVGLGSLALLGAFMSGSLLIMFGVPLKDADGNDQIDEFSDQPKWIAYLKRTVREFGVFKELILEPSSDKLLPDVLKDPWYQPPYTLVLELTGVLVHPDWTLGTGWRFKKRPGLDYFLQQVGPPIFETVVYTHEPGLTAFPIIDGLDTNGHVMFRLFRDATRYVNGTHVKDLSCLNRDLSKVIIVDCNHNAFSLQPRNGLLLKKWTGDDSDRSLVDLASFLRTIALSNVEDVRPVLEHYAQFDDPISTFKEKKRLLEEKEKKIFQESGVKNKLKSNWSLASWRR